MPADPITAIYETVLYAADPEPTAAFYRDVLGLRVLELPLDIGGVFRLPDGGVLLLFDPAYASQEGRAVPPHGARGPGHVAFRVKDLDSWRAHFAEHGIQIETDLEWPRGGHSLYVRDPAGNSVELVAGEIWP